MGAGLPFPGRAGGSGRSVALWLLIAAALTFCAGCQYASISVTELEIHQSRLNKTGLAVARDDSVLRITCAPPELWDQLPAQHNVIYSHEQWRSPDRQVGMGVAYMHTPVAVSPQTIIWFAKAEYSHRDESGGRLIGQWTDSLGRCWFEAENDEYHVLGYAMTRGCDAWIVYSGYRRIGKATEGEIALAARGAETVAPLPAAP
jgi:hypothetical protein